MLANICLNFRGCQGAICFATGTWNDNNQAVKPIGCTSEALPEDDTIRPVPNW